MSASTETASDNLVSAPATTPASYVRTRSRSWLVWVAAASGVVGQLLFSNDWCLYSVPAALLAAFAFWLVSSFVTLLSRPSGSPRWPVRFVLAVVIGLACGSIFRVIPSWAFREAFGIDRPAGISDVQIWRHYEGGPGEHSLILQFTADEAAIRALTASFPREPDRAPGVPNREELDRAWRESRSWMAAYELYGGAFHPNGRRTWQRIAPLPEPELFYRDMDGTSTLLLLDRGSRRVVALHSRG